MQIRMLLICIKFILNEIEIPYLIDNKAFSMRTVLDRCSYLLNDSNSKEKGNMP